MSEGLESVDGVAGARSRGGARPLNPPEGGPRPARPVRGSRRRERKFARYARKSAGGGAPRGEFPFDRRRHSPHGQRDAHTTTSLLLACKSSVRPFVQGESAFAIRRDGQIRCSVKFSAASDRTVHIRLAEYYAIPANRLCNGMFNPSCSVSTILHRLGRPDTFQRDSVP